MLTKVERDKLDKWKMVLVIVIWFGLMLIGGYLDGVTI